VTPNEDRTKDEVITSTRAPLNGHMSRTYLLNLKGPNWVSVPGERTLTLDVPVCPYALAFGHLIQVIGERAKWRAYNKYKERFF